MLLAAEWRIAAQTARKMSCKVRLLGVCGVRSAAQQADGADRLRLTRFQPTAPDAAAHRPVVGRTTPRGGSDSVDALDERAGWSARSADQSSP